MLKKSDKTTKYIYANIICKLINALTESQARPYVGIYHFWHKIEKKIVSGREGSIRIRSEVLSFAQEFNLLEANVRKLRSAKSKCEQMNVNCLRCMHIAMLRTCKIDHLKNLHDFANFIIAMLIKQRRLARKLAEARPFASIRIQSASE